MAHRRRRWSRAWPPWLLAVPLATGLQGAQAQTVIRFTASGGPQVESGLRAIIAEYQKEFPDRRVELTMYNDWSELHQKTLLAVLSGDPPDASRLKPLNAADFAAKGLLEPFDDLFRRDNIDKRQFVDIFIEKSSIWNGKLYIMPQSASVVVQYYNVDLFREAGLPNRGPETWDELVQFAKKITDPTRGRRGLWLEAGYNGFLLALWQNGGAYMNPTLTATAFNSPAGVEALQWMSDLIHAYEVAAPLTARTYDDVLNSKVGIWWRANSGLSYFPAQAPSLNWATYRMPAKVAPMSMEQSEGVVLFKTKNREAAWHWLKYLVLRERSAVTFYQHYGQFPVIKAFLRQPLFQEDKKLAPFVWHLLTNNIDARPVMVDAERLLNVLGSEVNAALNLHKSPKAALTQAQEQIDAAIREQLQAR